MNFLSFNSPFVQGLYKIANMILVSLLWILFCIPVFTAGASTVALYYTVQKNIKNNRGNSWSCFWQSFKDNFKQSTLITLIFLAITAVLLTDISIINTLSEMGKLNGYARIFFYVVIGILCIYAFWVYAYIARFRNTMKQAMKNALVLAVMHFPITLGVAAIGVFSMVLIWLVHVTVFIMPATSVWMMSFLTEKIFRLYMSEEDKQSEDERNMEWHDDYENVQNQSDKNGGRNNRWKKRR